MSVTIEQDLKEILTKIDQRLERIEHDVTDLKIGQVRLESELIGGLGNDTLTGGTGNDFFHFNSPSEGVDRLTDFNVTDDRILVIPF